MNLGENINKRVRDEPYDYSHSVYSFLSRQVLQQMIHLSSNKKFDEAEVRYARSFFQSCGFPSLKGRRGVCV